MQKQKSTSFLYKCWLNLYLMTLVCFLPFLFNFFWGNHDWSWVKEYVPLFSGVFEGRFSQFLLQTLFFSGNILPVLTISFGLLLFTLSVLVVMKLWQVPDKYMLLVGLLIVTAPYILSWFYFAFLTLSCLAWPLAVVCAFYLLNKEHKHIGLSCVGAILLFGLALGGYPPIINMVGTIFFTLVIGDLCLKKHGLRYLWRKYLLQVICVLCAGLLVLLVQYWLKQYNLQYDTYNTARIHLDNLFSNLKLSFYASVAQFFYTTSFIESFYKYVNLFLLVLAFVQLGIEVPKNIGHIAVLIFAICGLFFSSNITLLLAANTVYVEHEPRIEFFGLPYIYGFAVVILLVKSQQFIRNLGYTLGVLIIFYNFSAAAYCAKVWHMGFKAETLQMERIVARMEEQVQFNPYQHYTFVQSGTVNLRRRYYPLNGLIKHDSYTVTAPYVPWHLPYKAYTFYYPTIFVKKDFDVYWQFVSPLDIQMSEALKRYITFDAKSWPQSEAFYVSPELIVLTLTSEGKSLAERWYNEHY